MKRRLRITKDRAHQSRGAVKYSLFRPRAKNQQFLLKLQNLRGGGGGGKNEDTRNVNITI